MSFNDMGTFRGQECVSLLRGSLLCDLKDLEVLHGKKCPWIYLSQSGIGTCQETASTMEMGRCIVNAFSMGTLVSKVFQILTNLVLCATDSTRQNRNS